MDRKPGRILDPKIATNLRGRLKNNPQPIPASMAVGASGQMKEPSGFRQSASKQSAKAPRPIT
jgi:hypothetical protein